MMAKTAEKKEPPPSSSSSSKEKEGTEKEKDVYIRTAGHEYNNYEQDLRQWYVIHASEPPTSEEPDLAANNGKIKLRPFTTTPSFIFHPACVAWDSTIYLFNGGNDGPEVVYLDTRNPNEGWKIGPSMTVARSCPQAAVVGREIYVMGSVGTPRGDDNDNDNDDGDDDGPWGEVLDPLMNEWRSLVPHPGLLSCSVNLHAVLDQGKKVLIYPHRPKGRNTCLYLYDVDAKSWEVIDTNFCSPSTSCAVVDDILYCYVECKGLKAYDLVRHEWFVEPVRGLNDINGVSLPSNEHRNSYDDDLPEKVFLAHVGNGKLCLLWQNIKSEFDKDWTVKSRIYVRCTKFRVIKQSDGTDEVILHALIDSFSVYCFDDDHDWILDCLAL